MTSIVEVYRRWPTKDDCVAHLEKVRWGKSPICPYCGADRISRNRDASRDMTASRWKCQRCKRSFSVTVGTIFHNTHVHLQRWFLLISLMLSAKKGLSAMQAARDLEMRRPTVWSMMHRVRKAMAENGAELLRGIVEMDEAYVGGKPRRRNRRSDDPPGGQGQTTKEPIVGAVERGGRVKAKPVARTELTGDDMAAFFREAVDPKGTMLTTDSSTLYNGFNRFVAHRSINHSVVYSERDLFAPIYGATHTNTIESFWAIVKRAIVGQFHHVSRKYLPLYLNEITYRYNRRAAPTIPLDGVLHLAVNP
jgi:transposase-like protein